MGAQGSQTGAKEDTVALALSSTPQTDLSQFATNLTAQGGGAYETNSARAHLDDERTFMLRYTLAAGPESNKNLLVVHDATPTAVPYGFNLNGSSKLELYINFTVVWTSASALSANDYTFVGAIRANPETTGASDAYITEITVYDHTSGTWAIQESVTHAATVGSDSYTLSVGGRWDGAAWQNGVTNTVEKWRLSSSYHPRTEIAEDWVAARTAYSAGIDDGIVEPLGPLPSSSGIGNDGLFVGRHPVGYAAAHAKATRRRSWSPVVNECYASPVAHSNAYSAAENWYRDAPGSTTYKMSLEWLRWVPIPPGATHIWTRVQVRSYVTTSTAVPLGIRVYAMNRPPDLTHIGGHNAPALQYAWAGEVESRDDTSTGVGEWMIEQGIKLPILSEPIPGWQGTCHLCIAYAVDPAGASGNDANARMQVLAWHAMPYYRWTPAGLNDE
jgi:hypothetical protein